MGRIGTGWQLTKTSLRVLRADKELLVFPLISGLALLLILGAFIGGMFFTVGFDAAFGGSSTWLSVVLMIIYYIVSFFVGFFFNAAVIGAATIRLNGGTRRSRTACASLGRTSVASSSGRSSPRPSR